MNSPNVSRTNPPLFRVRLLRKSCSDSKRKSTKPQSHPAMSETDLERFPLPLNNSKKIGLVSFDARVNAGWQRPCLCCLLPSLLAPECLRGAWTTAVRSGRLFRIGGLTLLFAIDLASECLPERGVLPKSLLMPPPCLKRYGCRGPNCWSWHWTCMSCIHSRRVDGVS